MTKEKDDNEIELSIILPCLNEEEAIPTCLASIHNVIQRNKLIAEVIIVDNNSTDRSVSIIKEYQQNNPKIQLFLVEEKITGYGSAYLKGFSLAKGKYIFMADLDGTYDFNDIPRFMAELDKGFDLVVGNRFVIDNKNHKTLGSMPWYHRFIGNPFLSALVRYFFGVKIKDIHCGARAITKQSLEKLSLTARGMEFASEMIIKAAKGKLAITEIGITYKKRLGTSKLQTMRDGWRHLRFILLYSPLVIFLIPGTFFFFLGFVSFIIFYFSSPTYLHITFYIHPLFFSAGGIIVGYQLIFFTFFAKIYAITHMNEKSIFFEKLFKYITLERGCILGSITLSCGILIYGIILYKWIHSDFGSLNELKNSIVALTLLVVGVQTISSAFMLSIIGIKQNL